MDSDELAQHTVVPYDRPRLLAFELEVLRDAAYHGIGEHMAVVAKNHIIVYVRERVYGHVPADLSLRAHIG